ncbi:MAG: putative DNA binding domain-containing protein [Muribaculaceae bacterium]|nr:putative DNA binding domain-containing protein [Muribaculaceae bacterium]
MTIEEILSRQESQTFDCKSFAIDPKGLAVTIVAMANADGGELAVGISDRRREIEGTNSNPTHLNELIRVPYDFCNPTVKASFELLDCINRNGQPDKILLFHIQPSPNLHATQNDECYLRLGDKSRKLTFMERIQLMYDKGVQSFEDTPVMGATIDDLDLEAVKNYIDILGYGKSVIDFLTENHDFVREVNGLQKISTAAILLFGKKPQRFFPRARVRFIKYKGTEEKVGTQMNVVKDIIFEGTILNQIQKMVELLELQIDEPTYLGSDGLFVTKREYPHFVLQEMTVNACCHRDYSIRGTEIQIKMFDDRLVFESPGTLPGNVKPDNIRHTHFSRNPHIAQFLKAYKFVKEFGEGVDRMCREMADVDMEPPTYHLNAFILKATAKNRVQTEETVSDSHSYPTVTPQLPHSYPTVTDRTIKLLILLKNKELSTKEMMAELSLKDKTNFLTTYLYPTIEAELIKALYASANHPKQKYFLTAKGYELLSAQDKIIK